MNNVEQIKSDPHFSTFKREMKCPDIKERTDCIFSWDHK